MEKGYIDRAILLSCIKQERYSYRKLSHILGISHSALFNKVKGDSDFNETEISKLISLFGTKIFVK